MHLSQDKLGSIHFPIPFWFGEPDWHKVRKAIEFFNPEWVIISPRFDNADEFTSPPPTVVDCDIEYEVRHKESTGRYQSGYRVYPNGTYREDFGSDM